MARRKPKKTQPKRTQARHPEDWYCGARNQDGTACRRRAGWGTDTPGAGPCKHHRPRAGHELAFYVGDDLVTLAKRHAQAAGDDPFDLRTDIAAARAFRDELLTRGTEAMDAVILWSRETEQKPPRTLVDLNGFEIAQRLFVAISKMTEVQMRREALDSLTQADVRDLFTQIGDIPGQVLREVLAEHLPDLEPSREQDIVGHFARTVAERWKSLAARA